MNQRPLGPEFTLPSEGNVVKTYRSSTCDTAKIQQFDVSRLTSVKSTALRVQYPESPSRPNGHLFPALWGGIAILLPRKIVNHFTKFSDQRERNGANRAATRIGWRCRPVSLRNSEVAYRCRSALLRCSHRPAHFGRRMLCRIIVYQ